MNLNFTDSGTILGGHSPSEILKIVNNQLCQENEAEMFITVWLGILDLETGRMICGNAGHEYPAICKASGSFELFRDKHGMVLGGIENVRYKEYEMVLETGDRLFVYTDGVPEATDASEQLYGTERMLSVLEQGKALNAGELLAGVKADIDVFVGDAPQFDDITMLAFKYRGAVS